jgi:hypothetical protein
VLARDQEPGQHRDPGLAEAGDPVGSEAA